MRRRDDRRRSNRARLSLARARFFAREPDRDDDDDDDDDARARGHGHRLRASVAVVRLTSPAVARRRKSARATENARFNQNLLQVRLKTSHYTTTVSHLRTR